MFDKPMVMGIINITSDSFYQASRVQSADKILLQAEKMLKDGADIIDIGGQSTRPDSKRISAEDEIDKVIAAIEIICKKFPSAIISIDTYYAKVAAEAVSAGASIVNDISGGNMDDDMITTVGKLHVPYICMHMKGTPETMQHDPTYGDLVKEILDFFINKIAECKAAGINDIIIDPGFGFGKTIAHNFELLKNLSVFKMLENPIMAGLSRKSTVYKTLEISIEESLNGTTVLNTLALQNGANILRVHDVKEARESAVLFQKFITA